MLLLGTCLGCPISDLDSIHKVEYVLVCLQLASDRGGVNETEISMSCGISTDDPSPEKALAKLERYFTVVGRIL